MQKSFYIFWIGILINTVQGFDSVIINMQLMYNVKDCELLKLKYNFIVT